MRVKHVERLLEKDETGFSWSVEQVLSAACILATFHGLCCFVQGQGLTEDKQRVLAQISSRPQTSTIAECGYESQSDVDNHYLNYMKQKLQDSELENEEEIESQDMDADEDDEEQFEKQLKDKKAPTKEERVTDFQEP